MAELKPCPFCGAKAFIDVLCDREYVTCKHLNKCLIRPNTLDLASSIRKQINAWNRRDGEQK